MGIIAIARARARNACNRLKMKTVHGTITHAFRDWHSQADIRTTSSKNAARRTALRGDIPRKNTTEMTGKKSKVPTFVPPNSLSPNTNKGGR
jgi:hypothetical protein